MSISFKVLPIAWDGSHKPHSLYIKKDKNDKCLFLVNMPCYCNETGLRNIFVDCGDISDVYITDTPVHKNDNNESTFFNYLTKKNSKFKYAYITFKEESSVDIVLEMNSNVVRYINSETNPVTTGFKKWCKEYKNSYIDETVLQTEADEFLRSFDKQKWEEKEKLKNATDMDDEGWVTIPVKNKNIKPQQKQKKSWRRGVEKKKKKEKELKNFYLFQQRESKRDQLADLRKLFEEDKKKIMKLRNTRKFKPFS